MKTMKTYLITGAAGFIGSHLVRKLCEHHNIKVVGIDNFSNYYSVHLKKARLKHIEAENFTFLNLSITDVPALNKLFTQYKFDTVINLAAQPGVRYSIEHPDVCIDVICQECGNAIISKTERVYVTYSWKRHAKEIKKVEW